MKGCMSAPQQAGMPKYLSLKQPKNAPGGAVFGVGGGRGERRGTRRRPRVWRRTA